MARGERLVDSTTGEERMDVPWYTADRVIYSAACRRTGWRRDAADRCSAMGLAGLRCRSGVWYSARGERYRVVTLPESWLQRSSALRIRLVIPVYPGGARCVRTCGALWRFIRLTRHHACAFGIAAGGRSGPSQPGLCFAARAAISRPFESQAPMSISALARGVPRPALVCRLSAMALPPNSCHTWGRTTRATD